MGIGIGIAMPRKMLGCGDDAMLLQTLHIGHALEHYILLVLSERAHPNDRVGRIGVDVDHRGKVHVYADPFALFCDGGTHLINEFVILDGAQCHLVWE